jgi:hypothetical protein
LLICHFRTETPGTKKVCVPIFGYGLIASKPTTKGCKKWGFFKFTSSIRRFVCYQFWPRSLWLHGQFFLKFNFDELSCRQCPFQRPAMPMDTITRRARTLSASLAHFDTFPTCWVSNISQRPNINVWILCYSVGWR